MVQLVPYSSLTRDAGKRGRYVQVQEPLLHGLLRSILPAVEVDEAWYRQTYGDVDAAIRQGELASAGEHYMAVGYFEGRMPRRFIVDETWYLSQYADVAAAIRKGAIDSAQAHFDSEGYKEGRRPYADWSL